MKVFTNKYPVLGILTVNQDGMIDKESISVEFKEGKVFKVVGVYYDDFTLECEGKIIIVRSTVFTSAFTETDLSI